MAKNDEVAHSFQPLMGAHGGQVADPVIEAQLTTKLATSSMAHSHGRCAAASPGSLVPPCCTRVCQRCAGRSSGTGGGTRLISMRRFWARPSGVVFGASG